MADKRRNPYARVSVKTLALILSASLAAITLLIGAFVLYFAGNPYEDAKLVNASSSAQAPEESSAPSEEDLPAEPPSGPEEDLIPTEQPSEPETPPEPEQPVFFNVPDELRAVQIVAGRDYLTGTMPSAAELQAQMDKALADAQELTMNSIIIDTKYNDQVLFHKTSLETLDAPVDCVEYLSQQAKEMGFFVYATYDAGLTTGADGKALRVTRADGDTLDNLAAQASEFAAGYKLDGVLLTGYYCPAAADSYTGYLQNGGGMGYQAYLRETPQALVSSVAAAMRTKAPGTQVGLLTTAVWANNSVEQAGSETKAQFTALTDGNADTRAMVESGLFDFVMIENFGSTNEEAARFGVVAEWWGKVAGEAGTPLYFMHASERLGTQSVGWNVYEQLTKQVIDLEKMSISKGSAFASLKALMDNPNGATTTLVRYLNDQINEQYVLQQLAVSKPAQLTFTTKEQTVTFQGASDPQEPVTINDEELPTNDSGYFTIKEDLKPGKNVFTIAHKSKQLTYTITREVEVVREVQPVGSISVEGGMTVTVTAQAYEGAHVIGSVGGIQFEMVPVEYTEDEELRSSGYIQYSGSFTAPAATSSVVNLGTISITGTAQGTTLTRQGASVSVNKITQMGSGVVVQVVADQAETFPTNTLNDISNAGFFPLPQGTLDRTVGDKIVYKSGKDSFTYWKLQSGVRVYADDIKAVGSSLPDSNRITGMQVKSSASYTDVRLDTAQKIPYTVSYDGSKISFTFKYTGATPSSGKLSSNALFSAADWSGETLTLTLRKSGGFIGYRAVYDGNTLVLRFNNSPGSLKGARIVVDPGHGGNDIGATGFYPGKDEADINLAIASRLASELKERGASVQMAQPGSTMATRRALARSNNAQVLVSVHGNSSATNASAAGTEVYYFYPHARGLASYISANVAEALSTSNRGAKNGLYYMTRDSQFAAVLVETGFISNETEYTKLINSKYQTRIAQAIANGINSYLAATSSGGSFSGSDDQLGNADLEDVSSEDEEESDAGALTLSKSTMTLYVGDKATLQATLDGDTLSKAKWDSDDEDVATVDGGVIYAEGTGTTYVYAYTSDGEQEAKCKVTVKAASNASGLVRGIEIDGETSMDVDERQTLTAYILPSNAQDTGVRWKSSDGSIAQVSHTTDNSCKIEGLRNGTVTITATAYDDSGVTATLTVKVGTGKASSSSSNSSESSSSVTPKPGVMVQSIRISGPTTMERGQRVEYTGAVSPANAEDAGIKWSTSDSKVITISSVDKNNENLVKVESIGRGTAYLIGRAYDDSGVEQRFKITVR